VGGGGRKTVAVLDPRLGNADREKKKKKKKKMRDTRRGKERGREKIFSIRRGMFLPGKGPLGGKGWNQKKNQRRKRGSLQRIIGERVFSLRKRDEGAKKKSQGLHERFDDQGTSLGSPRDEEPAEKAFREEREQHLNWEDKICPCGKGEVTGRRGEKPDEKKVPY